MPTTLETMYKTKSMKLKTMNPRSVRKKLIQQLDAVFSFYIRQRDGFTCFAEITPSPVAIMKTKCSRIMQCNHLISRSNYRLRWDEKNAVCGCSAHNRWAHYNQQTWSELWHELWPDEAKYLDRSRSQTKKYSNEELRLLIIHYKNKLPKVKA